MNKRPFSLIPALLVLAGILPMNASAALVKIETGQTSVLLDTETLEDAAGLTLSNVSPDVIAPGNLGAASVAFGINSRSATPPQLPTTFAYDSADFLGTFSGTIEHTGSVFFNSDAIEVGDFTIGFSDARPEGTSGFFVESTTGVSEILFDIGPPSALEVSTTALNIGADLLVSPEFGQLLVDLDLASTDLTGAVVGEALVEGRAPVPATLALLGFGLLGLASGRRRLVRS